MRSDGGSNLKDLINSKVERNRNPILSKVESGIFKAITTGEPDPEGRGRLSAYIPKLGGTPDTPMYFQYASPFGGSNGSSNYGFFAVPPDKGLTVMVFFADGADLTEGYWFSVLQQVPNVSSGGSSSQAQVDGSGQGEGSFEEQPSSSQPSNLGQAQNPNGAVFYDEFGDIIQPRTGATASGDMGDGLRGGSAEPTNTPTWTEQDARRVEELREADESFGGGGRFSLTSGERAYAASRGYLPGSNLDAFGGSGQINPDATDPRGRDQRNVTESTADPDANDPRGREQRGGPLPNAPRNANLANQGTYTDPIRGQSSSTPMRDANYQNPGHSRVYGMSTPGQSALTFDDGSVDDEGTIHPSQIRLTTGSGAGIIIDGSNDLVYVVNSSGSSWVELGADGNISVYGSGSISMRAEGDINFRADRNFNIEAGQRINMRSGSHMTAVSMGEMRMKSEGNQFFTTAGSNHTKVGSNMYVTTGGIMHLNGPGARSAPGILTASMPDIQNMESTQTTDVIGSQMPSHEPYTRPSPANTGGGNIAPDVPPTVDPNQAQPTNVAGQDDSGEPINIGDVTGVQGATQPGLSSSLSPRLTSILEAAAETIPGTTLRTTSAVRRGSRRHGHGLASDTAIMVNGRQLTVASAADRELIRRFTTAFYQIARSRGETPACGIANHTYNQRYWYMGGNHFHFDISGYGACWAGDAGEPSQNLNHSPYDWLRQLAYG
jgi:hypothetical protein